MSNGFPNEVQIEASLEKALATAVHNAIYETVEKWTRDEVKHGLKKGWGAKENDRDAMLAKVVENVLAIMMVQSGAVSLEVIRIVAEAAKSAHDEVWDYYHDIIWDACHDAMKGE